MYYDAMSTDTPKKKRPADINRLAAQIVAETTGDIEPDAPSEYDGKNPAAVALGHLGGKKGGKARAEKLTPEQRKEIAQKAANARWKSNPPQTSP